MRIFFGGQMARHGSWRVVLLSLALGVWVGWVTCSRENKQAQG